MNISTDDRIPGTDDFTYQFVPPADFGRSIRGEASAPGLSREEIAAFWAAESDNARSGHFSIPSPEPEGVTAEKGLAAGVLKQAARDLRRFRGATKGVKHELYQDAYSWIIAYDFSWAYSFMNVCKLLGVCPEAVRSEILADASLGWLDYWTQRAGRISQTLRLSFVRAFAGEAAPEKVEATHLAAV